MVIHTYVNAQTNYLFMSQSHANKTRSRLSPTVFVAIGLHRAMWSLLRLSSTKLPNCGKMFRTFRLCPVLLSWVLKVITSPDATQLEKNSFVELSWVASGDVIKTSEKLQSILDTPARLLLRHASVSIFSGHVTVWTWHTSSDTSYLS